MLKILILTFAIAVIFSIGSNAQVRYGTAPVPLASITTSSTSVLIPVVNTYPPRVSSGVTRYPFEYLFWELALDSTFTRRVAWELWNKNAAECLTKLDTLLLRIEGIRPGAQHYFRVQALNVNPLGINPEDPLERSERFSPFTRPILIETPSQSLPDVPRILLPTNISHQTITLNWLPAQGLPIQYEVQASPDRTFQTGTVRRTTVNTSLVLNGLTANTRYFYRVRTSNQLGNSLFSTCDSITTKDRSYSFLTSRITEQEMRKPVFSPRGLNAEYYTYTQRPKISPQFADSLVQTIVNQNLAVDSLWFQDSILGLFQSLNYTIFIAKATGEEPRLVNLGFSLGSRPSSIDFRVCDGAEFYLYYNLTPVSVRNNNVMQKGTEGIEVFPNPANEEISFTFNLPVASEVRFDIYNILGHQMYLSPKPFMAQGQETIGVNVGTFPNSVYVLRVAARTSSAALPIYFYRQFTVMH